VLRSSEYPVRTLFLMLQWGVGCCSVLQCAAQLSTEYPMCTLFVVLQCVAVCCSVSQCVAVCCSVLRSVVLNIPRALCL